MKKAKRPVLIQQTATSEFEILLNSSDARNLTRLHCAIQAQMALNSGEPALAPNNAAVAAGCIAERGQAVAHELAEERMPDEAGYLFADGKRVCRQYSHPTTAHQHY
jgi:hypothetical protein